MVPVSVSSLGSFADDLDSIQPAQKIDANSTTTRHFIYSYSSLIISEWLPIAATCHDGEYDMASVENQISSLKLACFSMRLVWCFWLWVITDGAVAKESLIGIAAFRNACEFVIVTCASGNHSIRESVTPTVHKKRPMMLHRPMSSDGLEMTLRLPCLHLRRGVDRSDNERYNRL